MLEKIRNQASSWVFKIFLTVIALSFVLWGVGEFATGRLDSTAITVNGTKIPAQTVAQAYSNAVRTMEARAGTTLTDVHKQQLRIGEQTIAAIVRETLLTDYARELGIRISDEQLNAALRNMKNFQDADGNFDRNIYRQVLKNQHNMTIEGFEKIIKSQLLRLALNETFDMPLFADQTALERFARIAHEEIDIHTLTVTMDDIEDIKTPSEEEQKAYYQTTLTKWQTQEKRNFNVLRISAEDLAKNITIADTEASSYYQNNMDAFNVPDKRQAQHILVKTEEEAKQVQAELQAGKDFGSLAKKYSLDKFSAQKDGDLGQFAATDMVESFSKATFALKKDQVSDIVKTPFGFHLIKLTGIFPAHLRSFEQAKDAIKAQLAREKAEEIYATTVEKVEDMVSGGESLTAIAKGLELPLTPYTDKTRWDGVVDSSMLAPEESTATRVAFTLVTGESSDRINLTDTYAMYVEVTNITEPVQRSFAEVKGSLLKEMIGIAKAAKLSDKALDLQKQNREGKSLADIAKAEKLKTYQIVKNINKGLKNAPTWFGWASAQQFFDNPKTKQLIAPVFHEDKYTLVELAGRHTPEITTEMLEAEKIKAANVIGNDLRHQYMTYLYKNADISHNIQLLEAAMPGEKIGEELFK